MLGSAYTKDILFIFGFLKILRKQLSIQNYQKISSYLDTIEGELLSIQMQIAVTFDSSPKETSFRLSFKQR